MNGRLSFPAYLIAGIRNKPGRNLATVFCFAFIAASIFSGQYLPAGAAAGIDIGVSRMGADSLVIPVEYLTVTGSTGLEKADAIIAVGPSLFRFGSGVMDSTAKIRGVAAVSPQLYVTSLRAPSLSGSEIAVYGIDPETDFTIRPWLGRPGISRLRTGEVILGSGIAGDISSEITLFGHAYTVAGKLDRTQSPADHGIFMSMEDAYALAWTDGAIPQPAPRIDGGDISAVLVRIDPGQDKDAVRAQIWRAFPHDQVAVVGRSFTLDPASREVQELPGILNTISAIIVLAAFPLIAVISAMVARERQREIGLLRTMGAKRRTIVALVIGESLSLAAAGGLAGVLACLAAFLVLDSTGALSSILLVQVRLPPLAGTGLMASTAVLAVVTIGGLSALYPAVRSSLMNPYDAIRHDG